MKRLACGTILCLVAIVGCDPVITEAPTGSSTSNSSASSTSSGMGGAGGTGGLGGFGGGPASPLPQCTVDSDCTLVNDCCTCSGIGTKDTAPDCPMMECFAPACNSIGLPNPMAVCRAGQCVVDSDCNQAHALCNSIPPVCAPGNTPVVVNGCWGGCIEIQECGAVGACDQCSDGFACVTANNMMVPEQHCVPVPDSCLGQISCACMGEFVCGFAMSCAQISPTELKCVDITTK
jgi:hypothetical protein